MGQRLGQHFLKNIHKIKAIADLANISEKEIIIEIGPGHGELTEELLEKNPKKLIAVERDSELAFELEKKFSEKNNFQIILGDALKKIGEIVKKGSYKIIGNIPYYITGHIFRIIGELENKPKEVVFLIQKEVAERICAQKGKMNLLAATIQVWADPKIELYIGKNDFSPPPKVDSAVIKLITKKGSVNPKYFKIARLIFKQPRKTIFNNLRSEYDAERVKNVLSLLEIDLDSRPQELLVEDIKKISENL